GSCFAKKGSARFHLKILDGKVNNLFVFRVYLYIEMNDMRRKTALLSLLLLASAFTGSLFAQCSICTKTASQLGEGPASALNSAIIYL
ncbi:hypothetical protein AAEH76_21880, partial [Shewanella algae]|uniref:hypothetical protein n=1 Tax=Shewanella algae TaxID=38313 RepID=UPI00313ACB22